MSDDGIFLVSTPLQKQEPYYSEMLDVGNSVIGFGDGWESVISHETIIGYFVNILIQPRPLPRKRTRTALDGEMSAPQREKIVSAQHDHKSNSYSVDEASHY